MQARLQQVELPDLSHPLSTHERGGLYECPIGYRWVHGCFALPANVFSHSMHNVPFFPLGQRLDDFRKEHLEVMGCPPGGIHRCFWYFKQRVGHLFLSLPGIVVRE
jgi:hypothetical protein